MYIFGRDTTPPSIGENKACTFEKQKVAGMAAAEWVGAVVSG